MHDHRHCKHQGHHRHAHTVDPHTMTRTKQKFFAWAAGINLVFVLFQMVAAVFANSMGLLADAVHNLGDVLGLIFAWFAAWLLTRSSKERFSYGYKRSTILASLANALLLVGSCAIIAYESILKLLTPETIHEPLVILVASLGILVNGGTALFFIKWQHRDLNAKGAFLHLAADAAISLGVAIGGAVIWVTGWHWLDPVIGLGLVVVILMGTWGLLRDSVNLLLDAVPQDIDQNAVKTYLSSLAGVKSIHDLHIWGLSTMDNALTAHLVMPDSSLNDADFQHIYHELLERFNIGHVTLQIEKGADESWCRQSKRC